jgi:hypothetical protein
MLTTKEGCKGHAMPLFAVCHCNITFLSQSSLFYVIKIASTSQQPRSQKSSGDVMWNVGSESWLIHLQRRDKDECFCVGNTKVVVLWNHRQVTFSIEFELGLSIY